MQKLILKTVELFDIRNNISDFNGGKFPTRDIIVRRHTTMDDGQKYRTEHNLDRREAHKCIRKFNFKKITLVLNNFLLYNKNKIIQKRNNDGFNSKFYSVC